MYVIRDKVSKEIIYSGKGEDKNVSPKDVYEDFNPKTMEFGISDADVLPIHFKIQSGKIVELSLEEMVQEGIVVLTEVQKVKGGEIVSKSTSELVKEGIIKLSPDQKLVNDEIVEKTPFELCKEKLISLAEFKQIKLDEISRLAIERRQELVPDYKLQNAALLVYDDQRIKNYRDTVQAFKKEFKRIQGEISRAKTAAAVENVKPNFPEKVIDK